MTQRQPPGQPPLGQPQKIVGFHLDERLDWVGIWSNMSLSIMFMAGSSQNWKRGRPGKRVEWPFQKAKIFFPGC